MEQMRLKYDEGQSNYILLGKEVEYILEDAMKDSKIKISHIEKRVKTFESIMGKLQRKDKKVDNPFIFDDTLGVRVICLFLSDIAKIHTVIHEEFKVIEEDNKIIGQEVDKFGYMSVHYICTLKNHTNGRKMDKIKGIKFEIQVRTITMHSWANISHHLSYKKKNDIPSDLQKDFNALSGLFYVADKHFEMFYNDSLNTKEKIDKSLQENDYDQEINLDSLEVYLKIKFKDRKHGNRNNLSDFVEELRYIPEIRTIADLDEIIDKSFDYFIKFEKDRNTKRDNDIDYIYSDVMTAQVCMYIYSPRLYGRKYATIEGNKLSKKIYQNLFGEYNEMLEAKDFNLV